MDVSTSTFRIGGAKKRCRRLSMRNRFGVSEFWFLATDACSAFDVPLSILRERVDSEYKKTFDELRAKYPIIDYLQPMNWQRRSIFVSEAGLYQLICMSKTKEGRLFFKSICRLPVQLRVKNV
jgi:prophage antirepressor-like protein